MNFETDVLQNAGIAAEENLPQNNAADTKAVLPQRDLLHGEAAALLTRLTALETETPPLSDAQAQSLYRRAMKKAGLAGQLSAAAAGDAGNADGGGEPAPVLTASPRKKLVRWQRRALSIAAALTVMVLGGMALVRGGFGMGMEFAVNDTAAQYSTEAALDEPTTGEPMEDAAAPRDADFDALPTADTPAEAAAEKGTEEAILEEHAEEDAIVESTAPAESFAAAESSTNGSTGMGGISDGLADSSDKKETDTGTGGPVYGESRAEVPSGSTTTESTVTESTFAEESAVAGGTDVSAMLLMADGRLYRGTALVLQPDFGAGARLDSIADCIEADGVPSADGQANFAAEGAPFARWRSGLAVLLDGEWRYFEPVE